MKTDGLLTARGWNNWLLKQAYRTLERAYRAAQRIKTLEERYGRALTPAASSDPAESRYLQGVLDRQLLTIRFNLAQFQVFNFLVNHDDLPLEVEQGFLLKLNFIERTVAPYRQRSSAPAAKASAAQEESPLHRRVKKESGSFLTTLQEFTQELQPGYEKQVVEEIRAFRRQGQMAIRFLCLLLLLPLFTQILTKNLIYAPLLDHFITVHPTSVRPFFREEIRQETVEEFVRYKEMMEFTHLLGLNPDFSTRREEALQEKALEIFRKNAYRAVDGLANLLADLSAIAVFLVVARLGREQFPVLWGFMDRFFRNLNDPTKVFIFILVTDLFVGFHSVEGWEVLLETVSEHFGLTPNRRFIYAFIATVPVVLDAMIKFWIFNYLNRSSPSAVAVLEKMNQ
ncbi:MAG: hypothetical protein RMI89_00415 [Gloeomargarita sp. SKYBB_i_bin120]|nr:hypothetical protein [Gloeomargarita sp. SKYG98]MCS7291425.1 hypothetical protein [Gloeomargarita sp. SKYB120]MDW8176985.1 hypothetical protein [Gloeomargarita sp. SKYBB_i_bin120]